jgi:hypothetical protein
MWVFTYTNYQSGGLLLCVMQELNLMHVVVTVIYVVLGMSADQSTALVVHMCENTHVPKGLSGHRISRYWSSKHKRLYSLIY